MSNGTEDDKNAPIPPPGEPDPPTPDPTWDYYELGVYVGERLRAGRNLEDQAAGFGRRTAVQMWYAGQALDIVHKREVKDRGWKEWCKMHAFNLDTCYQALRLFRRSGGIENIRAMTITEARAHYQTGKGTWKPPGAEPQGGEPPAAENTAATTEPIAADATAEPTTEGTTATAAGEVTQGGTEGNEPVGILGRLQHDLEDLGTVADALAKPDAAIEAADANIAIKQIDDVITKLREAKKSLQKSAKASLKAAATVNANAQVGDDQ